MNRKMRAMFAAIGAIVLLLGGAFAFGVFGGPSDEELIKEALDEAILASKEGRPGGVVDFISRRFSVNGEQYGNRDISKTIKDLKPNVEIERPKPTITGDTATITSPIRLSVVLPPIGTNLSEVTLKFEKENGTKWLVIPTKKWRMVQVEMPDNVVEEVKSQFAGAMQL